MVADRPAVSTRRVRRPREVYNRREAVAGFLFISPWIIGFPRVHRRARCSTAYYLSFTNYDLSTGIPPTRSGRPTTSG